MQEYGCFYFAGIVRVNARAHQMIHVAAFQIDRLPNAGERAIPALLAERDFGEWRIGKGDWVIGWALHAQLHFIAAFDEMLCHIKEERQEPAFICACRNAVDPNAGGMENGTEMQENTAFAPAFWHFEFALVNADAGPHAQIFKLRLPRAGHVDAAHLHGISGAVCARMQELPSAIETDAGSAHSSSGELAGDGWRPCVLRDCGMPNATRGVNGSVRIKIYIYAKIITNLGLAIQALGTVSSMRRKVASAWPVT